MSKITESDIELFIIEELERLGYQFLYGPDISFDGLFKERQSYSDIILAGQAQNRNSEAESRHACRCSGTGPSRSAAHQFP